MATTHVYKIQAKASGKIRASSVAVLYGTSWEDCEGTKGLSLEECNELMTAWRKDDRRFARSLGHAGEPHIYRSVHV